MIFPPKCPICERPMMHTRLSGYRCHHPRHNEMRREINQRIIRAYQNKQVSEREWEDWMSGIVSKSIQKIIDEVRG